MGLTSCRWITIAGTLAHRRVAVERAADRYTLICDEPVWEACPCESGENLDMLMPYE
jgi:hypothetical protein